MNEWDSNGRGEFTIRKVGFRTTPGLGNTRLAKEAGEELCPVNATERSSV
jgi:hypothetical protein